MTVHGPEKRVTPIQFPSCLDTAQTIRFQSKELLPRKVQLLFRLPGTENGEGYVAISKTIARPSAVFVTETNLYIAIYPTGAADVHISHI